MLSMEEYQESVRLELAKDPFARTSYVHFEISNRCNLASKHPNCPLGPEYEKERLAAGGKIKYADYLSQGTYLSLDAVKATLAELGKYNFKGEISFHRYNDPLIDIEKLKQLVEYSRNYCADASIMIWTNAIPLTSEIANELVQLGVTKFIVSAYNQTVENRVENIYKNISNCITSSKGYVDTQIVNFNSQDGRDKWGNSALDDRITLYDRAEKGEIRKSPYGACFAPLRDITISHTGDVVICCLDWKDTVDFGCILTQRLSDILRTDKVLKLYCDLSRDIRTSPICRACGWSR